MGRPPNLHQWLHTEDSYCSKYYEMNRGKSVNSNNFLILNRVMDHWVGGLQPYGNVRYPLGIAYRYH